MKNILSLTLLTLLAITGGISPGMAHGVKINSRSSQAIEIEAMYDSGEPMSNGQVTIYAPDEPSTPWLEGTTDDRGRFLFMPDLEKSGNWEVKVRQAGHGNLISIAIEESADSNNSVIVSHNSGSNYSPIQTTVMIASIIWGCVGTALYFSQKKSKMTG